MLIQKFAMPVTTEIYLMYFMYHIHLLDYVNVLSF